MILINEEMKIIYCNSAFCLGLLYEKNIILESNLFDFLDYDTRDENIQKLKDLYNNNQENNVEKMNEDINSTIGNSINNSFKNKLKKRSPSITNNDHIETLSKNSRLSLQNQ